MIHLRTSTLEMFRRVLETEYTPEHELMDYLRNGQSMSSVRWQMEAGTAWHRVVQSFVDDSVVDIEEPTKDGDQWVVRVGSYWFRCDDAARAARHVGPGLCEITGYRTFDVGGQTVRVKGTADHIRGLVLQDHKTCFSGADPRDYEASLQWRIYLLLHAGGCFRYNLFAFKEPKDGLCELKDIVSFRLWPYAGMEADVRAWLVRFLDWAQSRHLLPYLQQPPRRAA